MDAAHRLDASLESAHHAPLVTDSEGEDYDADCNSMTASVNNDKSCNQMGKCKDKVKIKGKFQDKDLIFHSPAELLSVSLRDGLTPHQDDADQLTVKDPQADILRWHYRLGHA